ncbi:prostate stem cell antigen [Bos indicus]|uniref:Prostate stem cell antigen n=1 Tax=Bos indicus TaxID=9915 RepID=A0ABM4TGC0_BOSIN
MKALNLPLLAANLALQPGTALQCYSCEDQGNNEGCQRVQNCRTSAGPSVSVSGPCTPGLSASCPAPPRCPSDATPRPRPAHSPGRPAPRVIPRTPSEGISLLTVISKGCSSHCVEDSGNSFGSKKNIACCSTDLCNASRAQALQPAGVTQVLLGAPGHLLLWGRAQL